MALLVFPTSPYNGELYPPSPLPGQIQYQWDSAEQTWRLLGSVTGVSAGTYGSGTEIPVITVNAQGLVTGIVSTLIAPATVSSTGVVQPDSTYFNVSGAGLLSLANTGVSAGTYTYPSITVDSKGRIVSISSLPALSSLSVNSPLIKTGTATSPIISIANATTSAPGAVTLVNNTTTNDASKALTAAAGFNLQQQINAVTAIETITVTAPLTKTGTARNPILGVSAANTFSPGVVQLVNDTVTNDITKALTASAGFSLQQQIDALVVAPTLTFAGAINGSTGLLAQVTPDGTSAGFVVGQPLPTPTAALESYFVIVTTPGTFTPTGSGSSVTVVDGDWLVAIGSAWTYFNLGPNVTPATFVQLDDISGDFDGSQTVFPLTVGGQPYSPGTNANILISLGGVLQIPGQSFTISGSSIDFLSTPPESNTNFLGYALSGGTGGGGGGGGSVGNLQQVTDVGATTTNTITLDGTANPSYPLIIKSGSGQQAIRIAGRTADGRSYIDFTNPTQTVSYGYIQSDPTGLFFGVGVGSVITLSTATTTVTNNLQVAGSFKASNLNYPTTDGTSGQILSTDGSGTLSWIAPSYGPGITNIATGPGLTGGPITTTGTISLTNSGVTPDTYTYATVTVDINGRITVASSGTAPNTTVTSPIENTGTAIAPIIGIQNATTGQLGAVQVGTNIDVAAGVISVKSSTTAQSGIVQLNDTVSSTSVTEALTAKQGKALQDQISTLAVTSNLTLAGTFDATASQMLTVTSQGTSQSFVIGNDLPAAAAGNLDYFVIVTTGGSYNPPGGGGPYTANQGDWFLSNGTSWQFLNVGSDLPTASVGTAGIVELATTLETQTGTDATIAVTPAGAAATYLPISSFTAKGDILSATGANVPTALPVGSDNQILTACAAAASGLCWVTPPVVVPSIPCSVLTAKGALVAASGANTPATLPVGANGQVLAACSTESTGLCWITPPPPTPQATPTVVGTILGQVNLGSGGLGFRALNSLTTGLYNVGIAQEAGCSITTGNRNIGIGVLAVSTVTTANDNVGIGAEALRRTTTGFNNVAIGTTTLVFNTTGADNVAVGYDASRANTTGFQNVAIGVGSMYANSTFGQNTAVGTATLRNYNGGTNGANDAFGALAMCNFTAGDYNVALGAYSLVCYTSGCFNTAVGHRSMTDVTTGTCNTAIGAYSGQNLTTGCFNTAAGYAAQVCNGNNNTVLGNGASNVSGASNSVTLGNSSITVIRAAVTSITAISDARDKTDVTALPVGLDFINTLNPVKFTWQMREPNEVKDGTSEAGFIAQDLQAAQEAAGADYLGLVYDEDPEKLEASAGKLIPVLVKAIQELSGKVDFLQEELNELKLKN